MPASPDDRSQTSAESLFAAWLANDGPRDGARFESLLREHPVHAEGLRGLHARWELAERLRREQGLDASLSQRLRTRYGSDVDPKVTLSLEHDESATGELSSDVLSRLTERGPLAGRYRLEGEIARGGMGAVLGVWDEDLRRHLAMKVMLAERAARRGDTPTTDPRMLSRFLEEAQVTSQLDHPGIVPVHELGLDPEGRVYFTMKLVKGRTLKDAFEEFWRGEGDWTQPRLLSLVLKVCEAMSYAHAKGVIHRDLKPANVMVGRFGEVFVMDWGLAKVLGRDDAKDIRVRPEPGLTTSELRSERRDHAGETPDSPLYTMDGDIVGTPAYMPPEQAAGHLGEMGPSSDVYSVGAVLYHLMAGHMPYLPPGTRTSNYAILRWVQDGPPRPLHEIAPAQPPELVAICERAMEREPTRRYPDMRELAADLQAYLEGRVVHAYETGAVAELRKWVVRNKPLAGALTAAVLLLVVGLTVSLSLFVQARTSRQNVLRLSAFQELEDLEALAQRLWPAHPENSRAYRDWMQRAETLVASLDPGAHGKGHRAQLAELEARALPTPGNEGGSSKEWRFTADTDRWWHAQLVKLIDSIEDFANPETGTMRGQAVWGVERRLEWAEAVARVTLEDPRWQAAIASIANETECPLYRGLELRPQLGLVPIGRDPRSGLWEFAHLQTGVAPERGANGELVLTPECGLVFVLVPGGRFHMGAQQDPAQPNHDPRARPDEGPVHEVALSPFFIAKYEMSQAQWAGFTGSNPSTTKPKPPEPGITLLHPVETVSWQSCHDALWRLGLSLPSEAQWEYAARAGTTTPWSTGAAGESLAGHANISDKAAARGRATWTTDLTDFDDGFMMQAPPNALLPNPFGLHHVHGNVAEWVFDAFVPGSYGKAASKDPVQDATGPEVKRLMRGGGMQGPSFNARSTVRLYIEPHATYFFLGVRPARAIER